METNGRQNLGMDEMCFDFTTGCRVQSHLVLKDTLGARLIVQDRKVKRQGVHTINSVYK